MKRLHEQILIIDKNELGAKEVFHVPFVFVENEDGRFELLKSRWEYNYEN